MRSWLFMCVFVSLTDFVKRGVLTLVDEMPRYRNYHCMSSSGRVRRLPTSRVASQILGRGFLYRPKIYLVTRVFGSPFTRPVLESVSAVVWA